MAFEKKFELKLYVPATWEPAADMPVRWRDNMKNAATVLYDRLIAKVPDDGTFINDVAIPANKAYGNLLNPSFISKKGRSAVNIKDAQGKNMMRRYSKWYTNLQKAFAESGGIAAKEFKDKVDASIDNWAMEVADKTIRLTGDKIRGRGVAPIASFYLVGDGRATSWIKQGDVADGAPYNISVDTERSSLKAAIQQRLLQGGMMVINSEFSYAVRNEQNAINAELLSKLRDPARCDAFVATPAPDTCYCSWEKDGNLFLLHVMVGLTTT